MPKPSPQEARVLEVPRRTANPYGNQPWGVGEFMDYVRKADPGAASSVRNGPGRKSHPFDMRATAQFKNSNGYHSTCIETKVNSTSGLGFQSDKVEEILGPLASASGLCHSFSDALMPMTSDLVENGNGYLEVVREGPGGAIRGIYHVEAARVFVLLETDGINVHYEVSDCQNNYGIGDRKFAKFGDGKDFLERMQAAGAAVWKAGTPFSEIIHVSRRSALNRWYGWPDWLSAVAAIELMQMSHRYNFDFFLNRGVPEFMLFLLGLELSDGDWKTVKDALRAQIGLGNAHKSVALNIKGVTEHSKVQVEKMGLDAQGDGTSFGQIHETLALEIVSAHRIPPLLAGIVVPGKLGASNELPNALMATQALVVGPLQRLITTAFDATLGNPELNGGLGLQKGDFALNTILEEIDLTLAATVGGMKQPLAEANAEGRDLSAGMKKSDGIDMPERAAMILSRIIDASLDRAIRRAG